MTPIDVTLLSRLLAYDPQTGKLTWLPRPVDMFSSPGSSLRWHKNFCGKEAMTALNRDGYRTGMILERSYGAHRVAWALANGSWPEGHIDHINGDRADNRLANLRDVSVSVNHRNMKRMANNKSGHNGVHWVQKRAKWEAAICVQGRTKWLGQFDTKEDAVAARQAANDQHGFTERHGLAA